MVGERGVALVMGNRLTGETVYATRTLKLALCCDILQYTVWRKARSNQYLHVSAVPLSIPYSPNPTVCDWTILTDTEEASLMMLPLAVELPVWQSYWQSPGSSTVSIDDVTVSHRPVSTPCSSIVHAEDTLDW